MPERGIKPPIRSILKHMIKFNNNLMTPGLIPIYVFESLRRSLTPLSFALIQSCKTLSSLLVRPVHTRRLSNQLHLNTILRETSLPSSMEPVKVHLPIITYVDQNENSLSLREMMSLNGFINATSILMWKRLLSMISSNWPLII
jgi:hypothetical protein